MWYNARQVAPKSRSPLKTTRNGRKGVMEATLALVEFLARVTYTLVYVVGMAAFFGVAIYLASGVIVSRNMWIGGHKEGSAVI